MVLSLDRILQRKREKMSKFKTSCRICGKQKENLVGRICNECREAEEQED